jgi:bacterioferritin-associated ferredoxin
MVENLPFLESLDVSECEHITDSSIRQAAFHCHLLTHVNLSGCHQITDTSVKYLVQGCSHLSSLDLSQCNVSDTTLKHLRKSAHNIKQVCILGCPKITRDAVKRFQSKCSEVQYSQDPYPSQPPFGFSIPVASHT